MYKYPQNYSSVTYCYVLVWLKNNLLLLGKNDHQKCIFNFVWPYHLLENFYVCSYMQILRYIPT